MDKKWETSEIVIAVLLTIIGIIPGVIYIIWKLHQKGVIGKKKNNG